MRCSPDLALHQLSRAEISTKASAGFKPVPTSISKQNYTPKKVVVFFCKKSKLCYRNGYGVAVDALKAKSYFTKAAAMGLERAKIELDQPQAENDTPNQAKTTSAPLDEEVENAPIVAPKKLPKVKQKIKKGLLVVYTQDTYCVMIGAVKTS